MKSQVIAHFSNKELSEYFKNLDIRQLASKRILICGAGGLIGTALVELMLEINSQYETNIEIYALGRNQATLGERFSIHLNKSAFHILAADVIDFLPNGLRFDYIIQAASPAHPLAYSQTPVDVMKANLMGTINMLELARNSGAKLLFVSSGEIYGTSNIIDSVFRENDYGYIEVSNPRSCYPESKRAAETLCASYYAQYGVDTVAARLCYVYGPTITNNNSRADAQFLRNAISHEDIVMKSPGAQVRSFCYVRDAVTGLLYILLKGRSGEAYNIANKKSIASIREYAEILAALSGVKIKYVLPSETEAKGYSQVSRAVLDASKLEMLGWQPQYDLEQGLLKTYNDLQKRNVYGK